MHDKKFSEFLDKLKIQQDKFTTLVEDIKKTDFSAIFLEPYREKVFMDVEVSPGDFSVASVDCGFEYFEKFNQTLVLYKVCGAVFKYKNSKFSSFSYFPKNSSIELEVAQDLENFDPLRFTSLVRLKAEISTAIKIIKNHMPNILLLDGSLLPLSVDKPTKESPIFKDYLELLNLYSELFNICKKNNVLVAGVVKDSKSKRFLNMLAELGMIPSTSFSDMLVLNFILKPKQRTGFFSFHEQNIAESYLQFPKIAVCYIKTSNALFPIRLEVVENEALFKFPSYFLFLSSVGNNFAYPPILTEVDLRSRLNEEQIKNFVALLYSKAFKSPYLEFLNNGLKPFR
ncbi:MAG: DNA double-strand break repair nuclease NurA [Candidatus Anstonellaceae archaeon]